MRLRGTISDVSFNTSERGFTITVKVSEGDILDARNNISKDLTIDLKPFHNPRSAAANAMLWHCISVIASHQLGENKMTPWEIYISMLRKYGRYTMVAVRAEAVDAFKQEWRDCEEVGRQYTGDEEWVHLLCYFGSSTYDAKEFAYLLDGVIDDMKQAGLETPTSAEMRRVLEALEKNEKGGK